MIYRADSKSPTLMATRQAVKYVVGEKKKQFMSRSRSKKKRIDVLEYAHTTVVFFRFFLLFLSVRVSSEIGDGVVRSADAVALSIGRLRREMRSTPQRKDDAPIHYPHPLPPPCHLSISPHRHCQRVDANEVRCTESLDEILKPAISLASYRTGSILPGNNNMEAMPLDDPQTTSWWGRDPPGGGGKATQRQRTKPRKLNSTIEDGLYFH